MINREDATVATAVSTHLPTIARIIDEIVPRVAKGGRVIYMGAGTSGRLGFMDAAEMYVQFPFEILNLWKLRIWVDRLLFPHRRVNSSGMSISFPPRKYHR